MITSPQLAASREVKASQGTTGHNRAQCPRLYGAHCERSIVLVCWVTVQRTFAATFKSEENNQSRLNDATVSHLPVPGSTTLTVLSCIISVWRKKALGWLAPAEHSLFQGQITRDVQRKTVSSTGALATLTSLLFVFQDFSSSSFTVWWRRTSGNSGGFISASAASDWTSTLVKKYTLY